MTRTKRLPKVLNEEEQARMLAQFNTRYMTPHRNLCLVRPAMARDSTRATCGLQ